MKVSSIVSKITPNDIKQTGGLKFCHAIPLYLREDLKNALTHYAKNLFSFQVVRDDVLGPYHYLATVTDADPFGFNRDLGWYADTEDCIRLCHMLRMGDTGIQGSGKTSSTLCLSQAAQGLFNYRNFCLITYSNNVVIETTLIPQDKDGGVYRLSSISRPELLPIIADIIGPGFLGGKDPTGKPLGFKFPRNDLHIAGVKQGAATVVHLARFNAIDTEFPLTSNNLAAFQEMCLPMESEINVKCCFRSNKAGDNMDDQFNGETNVSNSVSSGITRNKFEQMYAIHCVEKSNMEVVYEYSLNGNKIRSYNTMDIHIGVFPGIRYKEEKGGKETANRPNLVTLRDVVFNNETKQWRKAGAKGGHDLSDSGHRIFLSYERFLDDDLTKFTRPHCEPIFSVHDSCSTRPYNYTDRCLAGLRPSTKTVFKDCAEFLDNYKELEVEVNQGFHLADKEKIFEDDLAHYYRIPFLKIWLSCKKSRICQVVGDKEEPLSSLPSYNTMFYVPPNSQEEVQLLVNKSLEAFTQTPEFLELEKVHKVVFPEITRNELNTVSLGIVMAPVEKEHKIKIYVRKEKENDQVSE